MNTQHAKTLGAIAFANGLPCVPALDVELIESLDHLKVGEGIPALKAWVSGWTEANISA